MRTRPIYLPIEEVGPGMKLGTQLDVIRNGRLRLSLPNRYILDEDNLHRLHMLQVEYICVAYLDTRSDEEIAVDAALAAHRTMEIFAGADLTDPDMAALFDQILIFQSQ